MPLLYVMYATVRVLHRLHTTVSTTVNALLYTSSSSYIHMHMHIHMLYYTHAYTHTHVVAYASMYMCVLLCLGIAYCVLVNMHMQARYYCA
ncbi:hypothetical protein MUP59_05820 [Candidatus Bathyarchaeota archaeon]|nr:hypothetical protein [Candidatus Bathyarchaeota archaeon]